MGNGNCYDNTKSEDKDLNVQSIFEEKNLNKESIPANLNNEYNLKNENNPIPIKIEENKANSTDDSNSHITKKTSDVSDAGGVKIEIEDFNYSSNSPKENGLKNYKRENSKLDMMKLVRHSTFDKICPQFASKFVEELNKARTNLLGFSEKLMDLTQNFEEIQKKIGSDKEMSEFSVTKEDFKQASDFFKSLHKEKKEKLEELVEIDEFKLPISENTKEMKEDKYYKKFQRRFEKKFSEKFIFRKVLALVLHEDPEISFLLFITKKTKQKGFIFEKEMKYIGIDFKEQSDKSVLLTINIVRDI